MKKTTVSILPGGGGVSPMIAARVVPDPSAQELGSQPTASEYQDLFVVPVIFLNHITRKLFHLAANLHIPIRNLQDCLRRKSLNKDPHPISINPCRLSTHISAPLQFKNLFQARFPGQSNDSGHMQEKGRSNQLFFEISIFSFTNSPPRVNTNSFLSVKLLIVSICRKKADPLNFFS